MHLNDAFILTLAYPETVVSHSKEWYSRYLRFFFIGSRTHVRAGHAALVLINKTTGVLEYHDFGRYITPVPNGRVRGRETDFELHFPITAKIKNNKIQNLDAILKFLACKPKLTHGDGNLYVSVCDAVNYKLARNYIDTMQAKAFIRYAAFIKDASNCARFVVDALIASVTDLELKRKFKASKWFTPSTIGNVILAGRKDVVYVVSEEGVIRPFTSTKHKENRRLFLDRLKGYSPRSIGTLTSIDNGVKSDRAQWLPGVAAGAWFEIFATPIVTEYRFRRISAFGNVDCNAIYTVSDNSFDINLDYQFIQYSNCLFFNILQGSKTYRFNFIRNVED